MNERSIASICYVVLCCVMLERRHVAPTFILPTSDVNVYLTNANVYFKYIYLTRCAARPLAELTIWPMFLFTCIRSKKFAAPFAVLQQKNRSSFVDSLVVIIIVFFPLVIFILFVVKLILSSVLRRYEHSFLTLYKNPFSAQMTWIKKKCNALIFIIMSSALTCHILNITT